MWLLFLFMIAYRPSYGYNEKGCPTSEKLRAFYLHLHQKFPLIAECIVEISYQKTHYCIKIWPDKYINEAYLKEDLVILIKQEIDYFVLGIVQIEIAYTPTIY